jgi:hypothetical protein
LVLDYLTILWQLAWDWFGHTKESDIPERDELKYDGMTQQFR